MCEYMDERYKSKFEMDKEQANLRYIEVPDNKMIHLLTVIRHVVDRAQRAFSIEKKDICRYNGYRKTERKE